MKVLFVLLGVFTSVSAFAAPVGQFAGTYARLDGECDGNDLTIVVKRGMMTLEWESVTTPIWLGRGSTEVSGVTFTWNTVVGPGTLVTDLDIRNTYEGVPESGRYATRLRQVSDARFLQADQLRIDSVRFDVSGNPVGSSSCLVSRR